MAFDTEGIEQLKLMLNRAKKLPEHATAELWRMAEETRKRAINMAPIDYGDLRGAIKLRETAANVGGRFQQGIRNFEIYISNKHPVSDPEKLKQGVTHVGDYAWGVHEYMGWGSTQGAPMKSGKPFMPSKESVAAGLLAGVDAGGKFLERAGEVTRQQMTSRLGKVIFRHI